MYCQNCGTRLGNEAIFCSNCGKRLHASRAAVEADPSGSSAPSTGDRDVGQAAGAPTADPILEPSAADPRPPDVGAAAAATAAAGAAPAGRRWGRSVLVFVLLIAVGAAAGSLYRAGYLGNRQESVASEIRSMFSANRIAGVEVTVSKDWIATVSGVVTSDSRRRQILTLLQQNDDIRSVRSEGLRVRPEPDAVERSLSADLVAAGARFAAVRVAVMPDYSVMVSGSVAGNEDAEKVRELIKASQWIARAEFDLAVTTSESSASGTPVSGTPASPVRDAAPPAALAVDAAPARQAPGPAAGAPALASQQVVDAVRSALAKAGVHGITAAAVAGQVVVLKGAVSSRAAKDAAFESARRAAPGYTVRDQVFIVD